jgi:hypothetical protein
MPNLYATRADLYDHGLPRGLLANPGRRCAAASASTDTFELDGHGFETDTALIFRAEGSGALPAPLVAGTTYYAIRVTDSTFKVAATLGGAAIDLTASGTAVMVATPLPFDKVIERYSRFVDGCLPAHAVPLGVAEAVPIEVVAIVAELSAKKLLLIRGQSSESMKEAEIGAKAQLERWGKGLKIRDATATASTNLAYSESVSAEPPRRWRWGGGGTLP